MIKQAFLFLPRQLANLLSALSMDDKGWSLKKILACYGTYIAAKVTLKHSCEQNSIAFVIIWLAWVGILVGIYSVKDISEAVGRIKNPEDKPPG